MLTYKAATQVMNDMGVTKLPSPKALSEEYSRLVKEKQALYTQFRDEKREVQELLRAKENVDRLTESGKYAQDRQQEKDGKQR